MIQSENTQIKEVKLFARELQKGIALKWDLAISLKQDWYINYESKDINFVFRTRILSHNIETIKCKWPTTWWDAVKERWFSKWLQQRFPIRYTEKTLIADIFFPYISIPWGKNTYQLYTLDYIEDDL